MNKNLQKIIDENNVIMIMEFGSQLYGTDTPESDTDYKGIFIPSVEQILLQKIPKSIRADSKTSKEEGLKNTKEDIDIELYSLNYFIDLCLKGETVGIDMLHCLDDNIVYKKGTTWEYIRDNRSTFYTNNLKGFVGYCRKQAAKYGIKGSRIADARKVLEYLLYRANTVKISEDKAYPCPNKLGDWWKSLPKGEHIHFVTHKTHGDKEEEFYQVCGKKLQKTARISYCVDILERFIDQYGKRALLAEKNQGLDWKALSHALRYGYQIKELFKTGDIIFPLKQRKFLTKVKQGDIYYKKVAMCLEELMNKIESLSLVTSLPAKPNRKFWEGFLINIYKGEIK